MYSLCGILAWLECKHRIKKRPDQKICLTCLWVKLCTFSGDLFPKSDSWVLLKGRCSFCQNNAMLLGPKNRELCRQDDFRDKKVGTYRTLPIHCGSRRLAKIHYSPISKFWMHRENGVDVIEGTRMDNICSCTSGVIFYVNYVICWKLRTLHRILFVESCSLAWIIWIHKHWMKGGKNGYKFCDCKSMLKTIACERAIRAT